MDTHALKHTWGLAEKAGDDVPLFFYSHLFLAHPELRSMFPVSMAAQRDRLVGALGRIVSHVDELDEVERFIQQLGRDHRRFHVIAEHYGAVGASLLVTLKHFLGPAWTPELATDWADAYGIIARVMVQAAEESEDTSPPSWAAEVLSVDRRSLDVAVVQVQPESELAFEPGQSVAVEVPQRPRIWRYLCPANAPRDNGSIELHVQFVAGGQVSGSILRSLRTGDTVRMGAPIGEHLTMPETNTRDLLMVAGATGLAPLRGHLERVDREWARTRRAPRVHLFHGARHSWNLYEDKLMRQLSSRPWFDYTPVVSEDPTYPGQRGLVGDVAARAQDWSGRVALVCGSVGMVRHASSRLEEIGIPRDDIKYEQFATTIVVSEPWDQSTESGEQP
ncbi:MAG: globin domain-containing protein [Lapillicoccus sp.]